MNNRIENYSRNLICSAALVLSTVIAGCGGSDGRDPVLGIGSAGLSSVIVPGGSCATADATIPTVTASDPTNDNQAVTTSTNGVAGGGKLITATFSLAMDATTITTSSFILTSASGAAITPASVTYNAGSKTATLTTAAALDPATLYRAAIPTTVKSATGVAIGCGYAWTFRTAAVATTGLAPVDLGTAAPFAIAAAAGLTTTAAGGTINGDLVLDPTYTCNAVPLPGCGGTAPVVNGNTVFNSAAATAVMADLRAAYNSLLPANLPGATVFGCGTIGTGGGAGVGIGCAGNATLPPGVYISATSSTIGVTGILTLDGGGDSNARFVFQAPSSTLTTAAGALGAPGSQIVLTNGAKASNVWWQVGSSATIGTYAAFQGNVLADTTITMGTSSTSCGRMLAGAITASGLIAMQGSTASVPGNVNAPAGCQ